MTLPQINVLGSHMAYREAGDPGSPVALFLHGNPTSSYIWRHIIADVAGVAHCLAPDLIGFGQSGKPDIDYRFCDHVRYLDAFVDAMGISSVYLVAQDWGTALAFELAARRPDLVKGLAFMEFIRPMANWDDFHQKPEARKAFQNFRTAGLGEKLIMEGNVFVEKVLPGSVMRTLTDEEMTNYREPFPTPESRKPTWRLPNELPIAGEPADVWAVLENAHRALQQSTYPKTLFVGTPGALVSPDFGRSFSRTLQNCKLVELGSGAHYLQEDHPREIASGVVEMIVGAASAGAPSVDVAVTYCVPCGYERRARDFAVELRRQLSVEAKLVPGKGGVFRVTMGERVLAARTKIHFPSTGELIEAVRQALLDSEGG